jgi:hypothetical protein
VSVDWNYKYLDSAENVRVSVNPLRISANLADFDDDADAVGIDYRWRVYSGTTKVQDVIVDGANHEGVNPVVRNPRNPRSDAGVTKIVVTRVGVDGDGLPGGRGLTFTQPVGIGFQPAS